MKNEILEDIVEKILIKKYHQTRTALQYLEYIKDLDRGHVENVARMLFFPDLLAESILDIMIEQSDDIEQIQYLADFAKKYREKYPELQRTN